MGNAEFRKATALLYQPLTIFSILILFINDHLLRIYFPSWITGKLGDIAWLYFSPFALAALISLIIPHSQKYRSKLIPAISFGLIFSLFTFANTSIYFNQLLVQFASSLFKTAIIITLDPSDLLALPSLGIACIHWREFKPQPGNSYQPAFLLLSICTLLTIANSSYVDSGIVCVNIHDGKLIAAANTRQIFESDDSGYTWQGIPALDYEFCDPWKSEQQNFFNLNDGQILYRISDSGLFEISENGGDQWSITFQSVILSQAEITYINQTGVFPYSPGPFSAVYDPETGNVIFAMGDAGILIHQSDGAWIEVPIDNYNRPVLTNSKIPNLISLEIALAISFLLICSLAPYLLFKAKIWQRVLLLLFFMGFLFLPIWMKPALVQVGYGKVIAFFIPVFLICTFIFALLTVFFDRKNMLSYLPLPVLIGFIGSLVFITPFFLWGLNIIPSYEISLAISMVYSLFHFIGSIIFFSQRYDRSILDILKKSH
jgi:hypothetical protein